MQCFDRLFLNLIQNCFSSLLELIISRHDFLALAAIPVVSMLSIKRLEQETFIEVLQLGANLMARTFARILGLFFLLAGFVIGLIDGTRSIAASKLDWTNFGSALNWLMPERMAASSANPVTKGIAAWAWDYGIMPLLTAPAIALFFGIGVFLLILVRDRKAAS